jgi:broad specificity phosphatase PhoE
MSYEILKNVYLVRHGQSVDNNAPIFQRIEAPLSERGVEQAKMIAKRASKIEFDELVSSPYIRAKQTAEFIENTTEKKAKLSELFVERIKPTRLNGMMHGDPIAEELKEKWEESLFKSGLWCEDGENYDDLIKRADDALNFLNNLEAKNIFVVTHGFFLRTIISRVLLGNTMNEDNYKSLQHGAFMKNTGLTVLQYGKLRDDKPKWRLWVYNDHSHLG